MPAPFLTSILRLLVPWLIAIVIFSLCYFLIPDFALKINLGWQYASSGNTAALTAWFHDFGTWGPVVIIAFMVVQMFFIVFPSWLPMVVATLAYGPFVGSAIGLGGVMLSSLIGYHVGDKFGAKTCARLLGPDRQAKLCRTLENYGFGGVMLFRMSPFLATDAISFIAGIVSMPLQRYLLATLLGTLPLTLAIAYFGQDVEGMQTGMWWMGGIGVVAYVGFIVYRKMYPKQRAIKPTHTDTSQTATSRGPSAVSNP